MLEKNTHKFLREYTEYDANGNKILQIEYHPDGTVEQKTVSRFNNKNLIVEEQITDNVEVIENKAWEYDDNGRVVKELQYYIDGAVDTTEVFYDADGNIIERKTTDHEGETGAREIISYINGKIAKHTVYDEDGEIEADEQNTWDEQNRLIKKVSLNLEGEKETLEIEYNEDGSVFKEILLNEDGKIIERNTYTYGENGMPKEIHEETTLKNNVAKIQYNENKQVTVHEVYDVAENLINKVKRNYDDKNRVSSSEILISIPEKGIRHHYQLTYEYEE